MKLSLLLMAAMIGASLGAQALAPTQRVADVKPRIDLEAQVPRSFGEWQVDPSIIPLLPSPDVQAKLDTLYSQVLARTYVNGKGDRVMLSIAYGSDQGSQATQVHRPEFCYTAQGFRVAVVGEGTLDLDRRQLPVRRIIGSLQSRIEPITYWLTLDEAATLPGLSRKLQQIREGLQGRIPDGMLVRISTIDANPDAAWAVQNAFVRTMLESMPHDLRARYFGREAS